MKRHITWVDANIVEGSPSMQNLLRSFEDFEASGFEISLACIQADARHEARILKRHRPFPVNQLRTLAFAIASNVSFALSPQLRNKAGIIHSTGSNVLLADIISIHFLPADWLRISLASGNIPLKDLARVPLYAWAACMEWLQRAINRDARFHVVSEKLASSLIKKGVAPGRITVIPTPYNPARFNSQVRLAARQNARDEYGFCAGTCVFSFVSQGAYYRKGLHEAVEVVARLRAAGRNAALMVIGGRGASWQAMRDSLLRKFPDSAEWLKITGFVPDLAHALSASDAFLFPSKYEGCAAVEIEAAALGLQLILTDHPGSEMHLVDGENGLRISSDPAEAASRIDRHFDQLKAIDQPRLPNAITQEQWAERMLALYREVAGRQSG